MTPAARVLRVALAALEARDPTLKELAGLRYQMVQEAIAAGVGAEVTLTIGAKLPMPLMPVQSSPLTVTGVVQTISAGTFVLKGGLTPGLRVFMGPTVVLNSEMMPLR